MRSLKGNLGLVLVLLFISVLYFGLTNALADYYITSEKIVSSGTRCSDTGFEEVGTFPKGDGQIIRHCVQRAGFSYSGLYVTNSYFEVYDGIDDCKDGGDTAGSFNDVSGEEIINLCIDRKTGDSSVLNENMLITNVSIINGSGSINCSDGFYNTGISVQVSGGSVIHCASGGQAGGGRDSEIREKCENYSGTINDISSECIYNLSNVGISGAGESLNGVLQTGAESCPQLSCTCMAQGFSAYSGWNCTTIEEVESATEECSLTNARWTNLNLESKTSANVRENLSLVVDVSDSCAVGRAVKCDIYKKVEELEREQYRITLNGNVNVTTNSNTKVAFCQWSANLFSDSGNTSYYFNIWFNDNANSKIRAGDIEIKNETTEELLVVDDGNGNITWTTSTEYNKNRYCPQDQFIVRVIPGKIFCAQLNKSNGEPIVWGGDIREIGLLNTARGLKCEKNEGAVGIPRVLLFIPFNSFKCATMQDGEGVKVVGDENRVYRQKSSGCEYNEVISSMNVLKNVCWTNLRLTTEEPPSSTTTPSPSNTNRGLFGGNGLFAGIRNGPLGGILSGLLGNLGGLLNIFR